MRRGLSYVEELYSLVEASDILPLLLLPQLISLQLKVSYELDSCHLLPTQWDNLTHILFLCETQNKLIVAAIKLKFEKNETINLC